MKKRRFSHFFIALFSFALLLPLASCGPSHAAKEEWAHDNENHWHECVVEDCDEHFNTAPHTYGSWKITLEPTCETKGARERSCTVCGYKVTEELAALGHEKKTTWTTDEHHHWHECKNCDEKLDLGEHTYGDYTIAKEPTCTEKGSKYKVCTVCGYKVSEEIPALGHDFASEWSHDEHQHWKSCSHCDEKHELADHTYGEFVIDKPATCTEKGSKYHICTVCKYKEVVEIPALGHDFATTWTSDATHHWKGCSRCDEKHEYAPHTYGDWTTTVEPTCTTVGSKKRVCSVCLHEEIAEIPALGHDISKTWSHDENQHWKTCSRCNEKHELADHTYGEWVIDSEGTCAYPGSKHRICTVCGYKQVKEEITAPHLYSSLAITKDPTTAESGILTIVCAYGHTETVTMPKVTETDYYSYVTQIDADRANVEYSVKEATVTKLLKGTMAENVEPAANALIAIKFGKHIENIACPHNPSDLSYEVIKEPSYEETGIVKATCANCNKEVSIDLPKISIDAYTVKSSSENNGATEVIFTPNVKTQFELKNKLAEQMPNAGNGIMTFMRDQTYTMNRWYTLNIAASKIVTEPNVEVKLMIAAENCTTKEFNTGLTIANSDKFTYELVDGKTCIEPVIKFGKISEQAVATLNIANIKNHPEFTSKVTALRVIKVAPTEEEIAQNIKNANKHTISALNIKKWPTTSLAGLLEITCNKGCNYSFEYPIAMLDEVSYTRQFNNGRNVYTPTDEYLAVIAKEVVKKFNASINEVRDQLRPTLTFNVALTPEVSLGWLATTPSGSFAIRVTYNDGADQDEMAGSTFNYANKPEYYSTSITTVTCNQVKKRLYLNDAGIAEFLKLIKSYNRTAVERFLKNNFIGEYDATDEEISENKIIQHAFIIDEIHSSADMGNVKDKYITWHCRKCHTNYRIDYSFNDVFVENENYQMVADINLIINLIKVKYPAFTAQELEDLSNIIFARITEI